MSRSITEVLKKSGASLVLGASLLFSGGCAIRGVVYPAGPPPGVVYDYDYYPDWNVYFYPRGGIYYWHDDDDGHWHSGVHLPHRYEFHHEHPEHLRLHTPRPWTAHRPAPHRESREEHGRRHDHH